MTEQDPGLQRDRQMIIQDVVRSVTRAHGGQDVDVVRDALTRGLAEAGVPEQPQMWTQSTVEEISEGRHVVVDRALGKSEHEHGHGGVPDQAGG